LAERPLIIDLNAPVHVADIPSYAQRFWAWWLGELNALLPGFLRRAVPKAPEASLLFVEDGRWRLVHGADPAQGFTLDSLQDDKGIADQILAAAPNFSLLRLVVVLPASQVLRRRVELPLVQERQLLPAVELQVDRLTPFKADAVRLGVKLAARDAVEGKVTADCAFAPRAGIDALDERLRKLGLGAERFDVAGEGGVPQGFSLAVPGEGQAERQPVWTKLALAGGVLLAWYVAGLMWDAAREQDLRAWEARVAEIRPQAMRSVALRQKLDGMVEPFELARRHLPDEVLSVLQELTQLLPDSARLTEFEFKGDTIRIAGVAQEAASLIPLLEKSARFRDVRFLSQVMRQEETKKDRFEIALKLEKGGS
jgi:general secretion pathway protein L